jgi:hypothetical protein
MRTGSSSSARRGERGAALPLAFILALMLAVLGIALLRLTGQDRVDAAKMGTKERAQMCADAGLQYGRRFFGLRYEATHNWNDYLDGTAAGYRYDPDHLQDTADAESRPPETRGKSDGANLDAGADVDDDGEPDFWVSIRDDDDEQPLGGPDTRTRDNNETVILRSECTNTSLVYRVGGEEVRAVVESVFTHVQGASGYGNAQITSNSPDVVGEAAPP